jgi:hypothetical protein
MTGCAHSSWRSASSPEDAEAHARDLLARHHGTILMAYAQDDESLIASGVSSLLGWLGGLRGEVDHVVAPVRHSAEQGSTT